jgi:hypothetical protein
MKDDVDAASQRFPNETYVYAILVSNWTLVPRLQYIEEK